MSNVLVDKKALIEGERPLYNASYGKLMMWFFLVSDAFTFSALLIAYGSLRVRAVAQGQAWADPEAVFTHTPVLYEFFHIEAPLVFVGIMTFILILSSVTMVLAVEAGHRKSKQEVSKWVFLTVIGGATFLGCQAYEWYHFIHGTHHGGIELSAEAVAVLGNRTIPGHEVGTPITVYGMRSSADESVITELRVASSGYPISDDKLIALVNTEMEKEHSSFISHVEGGANLKANEYGPPAFADLFFFVTGFHGTHVLSGVLLLIMLLVNVNKGTYERRGHYEMTEKIGLYWHFVDLVWVFVFTFFYLV